MIIKLWTTLQTNSFPKEPVTQIDYKIQRLKPSQISKTERFAKIVNGF